MPSKATLRRLLRDRIAAAIREGSGAEVKNLCDALRTLEAKAAQPEAAAGPQRLTVSFIGDAAEYAE